MIILIIRLCCQHHIHTHAHTLYACVCVHVRCCSISRCCCFRVCLYIWEYFNSVCCVYASRLVRERHMHARHSSVHSLSRSNVRDRDRDIEREREREMRVQACVCVHAHTHKSPFSDDCCDIAITTTDDERALMIPPQVHLRRPCYDFSFL